MNNNTMLRQESIKKVFSAIRENGPLSKRQLQDITGFSWGNISSITSLLTSNGYLTSIGKQDSDVGRKPECFDISVNDNYIIGIDFNFEGVAAVVCNLNGKTVWKSWTVFEVKEKDYALEILFSAVRQALDFFSDKRISAIAIAIQGKVDTKDGISLFIDGIKGWTDVPVVEILQKKFGLDVFVIHDPDGLLYTEKYFGVIGGNDAENAVLIRMDHDIGIGVMYHGNILMSGKGKTCEIGNMVVPSGKNGNSVLRKVISTICITEKFAGMTNEFHSFENVAALAYAGIEPARELFDEVGTALGYAVNNVSMLLNPEKIVLYGTIAQHSQLFLDSMENTLKTVMGEHPSVFISKLDGNAAAIGATLFAADMFVKNNNF